MLPQAALRRHACGPPAAGRRATLPVTTAAAVGTAAGLGSWDGGLEMADSRQLRRLIDYNQWADERILAAIDGLSSEDLARPREAYFGSIAQNLRHVVAAQRNWLARWKGTTPRYDEEYSPPWREIYAETHAALRPFVGGLTDDTAEEVLRFK